MKKAYKLLSLNQVDDQQRSFKGMQHMQPELGWIAYIRSALCFLYAAGLGRLMTISQPSASHMAVRERTNGNIESLLEFVRA